MICCYESETYMDVEIYCVIPGQYYHLNFSYLNFIFCLNCSTAAAPSDQNHCLQRNQTPLKFYDYGPEKSRAANRRPRSMVECVAKIFLFHFWRKNFDIKIKVIFVATLFCTSIMYRRQNPQCLCVLFLHVKMLLCKVNFG